MTTHEPWAAASLHAQPPSTNQQDVYYLAATSSSLQGAHDRLGVMIGPRQGGLRPLREVTVICTKDRSAVVKADLGEAGGRQFPT